MRHSQSTVLGLTDADILAAINAIPLHPVNTDPAWKTVQQWASAWGVTKNTSGRKCDQGAKAGLMAVEQRYAGEGSWVRKQSHYKFIGKRKQGTKRR